MSRPRSEFKTLLETTADDVTVYGEPPTNTELVYPCIIFAENFEDVDYADNLPYYIIDRYEVTIIESDPTRPVAKAVRKLPWCSFNRRFVSDQLIHTVYNIFF